MIFIECECHNETHFFTLHHLLSFWGHRALLSLLLCHDQVLQGHHTALPRHMSLEADSVKLLKCKISQFLALASNTAAALLPDSEAQAGTRLSQEDTSWQQKSHLQQDCAENQKNKIKAEVVEFCPKHSPFSVHGWGVEQEKGRWTISTAELLCTAKLLRINHGCGTLIPPSCSAFAWHTRLGTLWIASEEKNGRKSTSADNRLQIAAQSLLKFDGCYTTLKVLRKWSAKEAFKNRFVSDKYVNLYKARKESL